MADDGGELDCMCGRLLVWESGYYNSSLIIYIYSGYEIVCLRTYAEAINNIK